MAKPEAAIQLLLKSRDLKAACGFLEAKAGGNAVSANEWYYFKAPGGIFGLS